MLFHYRVFKCAKGTDFARKLQRLKFYKHRLLLRTEPLYSQIENSMVFQKDDRDSFKTITLLKIAHNTYLTFRCHWPLENTRACVLIV
jgi:hypothetical protein